MTEVLLVITGVLACIVFAVSSPYFLSSGNLVNVLQDLAVVGVLAVPATFLIMTGNVDLSVGAAAAFAGIVLAATAPSIGLMPAVLLAVGTGLLTGLTNGLLVTLGGINSIAMTFAAMALLRALSYLVPSGLALGLTGFRTLGTAEPLWGLPLPALILLGVAVLGGVASRSRPGHRFREIGRLPAPTRLDSGRERRTVLALFVLSGLAAAVVGLMRTSQLGTGLPSAGTGAEVVVIASVILGGGRLAGGRGSIRGTVLALLVITVLDNGLSLANVTAYASQVLHATLLVVALVVNSAHPARRSDERAHGTTAGER
ncbi:ABC transporter permease [Nakamurella flavida]|uniref:ABC transporter permease n=1 Tax=Nakamurella flavida TaxID=363630 RepID=A0A938YCV6_9ACTN|nr:ABC transporter permease [Nakamurella flavida]MBM9475325.1 ABC transporter permease [Nakamurella flavida]MDP9776899.1 ribose transport system permease protein [Nakamurella flavida]